MTWPCSRLLKTTFRDRIQIQMLKTKDPALSKQTAIEISCNAYRSAIIENLSNVLMASGILNYTIFLLFNSTSVSVSIKVGGKRRLWQCILACSPTECSLHSPECGFHSPSRSCTQAEEANNNDRHGWQTYYQRYASRSIRPVVVHQTGTQ